jgi:hypothetical protein
VKTVAAGGLPVIDVSATTKIGLPVIEAAMGMAVTKVTAFGIPVAYVAPPLLRASDGETDRGRAGQVAGRSTEAARRTQ